MGIHAVCQCVPGTWRPESCDTGSKSVTGGKAGAVRPAGRLGSAADAAGLGGRAARCLAAGRGRRPRRLPCFLADDLAPMASGAGSSGQRARHVDAVAASAPGVKYRRRRSGTRRTRCRRRRGRDDFRQRIAVAGIRRPSAAGTIRHLPDAAAAPDFARMPWRDDRPALPAWQQGRTGIPIVDAGMRQLWHTGWMHNRVRMIAASFLVKHLLLPWQEGEAWFWDTLVDADLANNSAQLAVGRGLRRRRRALFPHLQPGAAGPEIRPRRRLCASLGAGAGRLDRRATCTPRGRRLPDAVPQAGVALGKTYPQPIVDLAAGRARGAGTPTSTFARAAEGRTRCSRTASAGCRRRRFTLPGANFDDAAGAALTTQQVLCVTQMIPFVHGVLNIGPGFN